MRLPGRADSDGDRPPGPSPPVDFANLSQPLLSRHLMADEALDAAVAETQKLLGAQIQKVVHYLVLECLFLIKAQC